MEITNRPQSISSNQPNIAQSTEQAVPQNGSGRVEGQAVAEQTVPSLETESNLTERFQRDAERAGLVGEKENGTTILLCSLSAKLAEPLSVSVQGASSAGKNHLIGTVYRFLPDDMKKSLSGMTPKTLMHAGQDEFEHKAVFIAEYEGVSKADYAIRTFQSEKIIEWHYVDSTSAKGIQKKANTVKGSAAFIQATTRAVLHPENETRLLFVQMDESPELTRAIMLNQAMRAEKGANAVPANLFEAWQQFIRSLTITSVRIPFAGKLAQHFPASKIRSRRDFPKLLGLIESSAFLHQHQRRKDGDYVIASPSDYLIAKKLFEHSYSASSECKVAELVKVAESFPADFPAAELMTKLGPGWGKTKTYEVLKRADELGYVAETDIRGRYRFLGNAQMETLDLPETLF